MCPEGAWTVLEGLWKVLGRCLEGVCKVSGGFLECALTFFGKCLEGVSRYQRISGRCQEGI